MYRCYREDQDPEVLSPSENIGFATSERKPTEQPTGNKLQQFGRAAAFVPVLLIITQNPMGKVKPNI